MARKCNCSAPLRSTHKEAPIWEFVNSDLKPEHSKQQAAALININRLLRNARSPPSEDQIKLIDELDQACRDRKLPFLNAYLPSIASTKAYLTFDSQSAKSIIALGNVCSTTGRLPTSAVLSTGLEKHDNTPAASGKLADIWRGELCTTQVAIKAFRIYPAQNLEEAKKVRYTASIGGRLLNETFRLCGGAC